MRKRDVGRRSLARPDSHDQGAPFFKRKATRPKLYFEGCETRWVELFERNIELISALDRDRSNFPQSYIGVRCSNEGCVKSNPSLV